MRSAIDESVQRVIDSGDAAELRSALASEAKQRRRAECLANIQTEITKYTLDLLVRVPDLDAFFRALLKTLAEEGESHAAGVWLIDEDKQCCDFWMAHLFGEVFNDTSLGPTYFPRLAMAQFLFDYKEGWEQTNEYRSDDPRLPQLVRQFNDENGLYSTLVAPLILGGKNLGWITLCVAEEPEGGSWWRIALVEAIARHAALALHKSRIYEQKRLEERRKAILEERNRLARDIHDNLAQGFGAILMQLQAAQREGTLPPQAARNIDIAVDLARTHMVEARRSVGALRPNVGDGENLAKSIKRLAELATKDGEHSHRRPRRRAAAVRRRRRARGHRDRAGSDHQRAPSLTRAAHHDPCIDGELNRPAVVGGRRRTRHSAGTIVLRASA